MGPVGPCGPPNAAICAAVTRTEDAACTASICSSPKSEFAWGSMGMVEFAKLRPLFELDGA